MHKGVDSYAWGLRYMCTLGIYRFFDIGYIYYKLQQCNALAWTCKTQWSEKLSEVTLILLWTCDFTSDISFYTFVNSKRGL